MRSRTWIWIGVALVGTAIALYGGARVLRDWRSRATAPPAAGMGAQAPPGARFAAAYAAAQRGELQQALNAYRELQADSPPEVRHAAMYNSGNLYLERALSASQSVDKSAALTFAELAKDAFRELLREDPEDFDARYNLEKTLRFAPDPPVDPEAFYSPPTQLHHSAPTGPGTSPGLP